MWVCSASRIAGEAAVGYGTVLLGTKIRQCYQSHRLNVEVMKNCDQRHGGRDFYFSCFVFEGIILISCFTVGKGRLRCAVIVPQHTGGEGGRARARIQVGSGGSAAKSKNAILSLFGRGIYSVNGNRPGTAGRRGDATVGSGDTGGT